MRSLFGGSEVQTQSHVYHKSVDAGKAWHWLAWGSGLLPRVQRAAGAGGLNQGDAAPAHSGQSCVAAAWGASSPCIPCHLGLWCR